MVEDLIRNQEATSSNLVNGSIRLRTVVVSQRYGLVDLVIHLHHSFSFVFPLSMVLSTCFNGMGIAASGDLVWPQKTQTIL